ncbi:MAG: CBS domain-containing protein [Bacteroidota bacterium]
MDYITNDYKALDLDANVVDVKLFFRYLPFTHFPIVENGKLIGMLAQADIVHLPKDDSPLHKLQHFFKFYKTDVPDSCLDLIGLFAQNDTDILPVTDDKNNYLGYFELDEIIRLFYNSPLFKQGSTTLIIEKETTNFFMSEIAQIIETNNITLLGMYISKITDNHTQITLRLDTEEVNEVIQSLRRYEYEVITESKNDLLIEELKDRSEYLNKFLNI